jgi:formylglycine-generating enzyme required for sulfatase activity
MRALSRVFFWSGLVGLLACGWLVAKEAHSIREARAATEKLWTENGAKQSRMIEVPASSAGPRFTLDATEVTVSQYRVCVAANGCTPPATGEYCNWQVNGRDSHPINCVDQRQAAAYCAWTGRRLPTAAEWQRAAGCDAGPPHECVSRHAETEGHGFRTSIKTPAKGTCSVDTYARDSIAGLGGNVSEWTSSELSEARRPSNRWISLGLNWMVRENAYTQRRVCADHPLSPVYRDGLLGFRCAKSEPPSLWSELRAR